MDVIISVHTAKFLLEEEKADQEKLENIIEEAEKLAVEGFKEIILIGINLGATGEDFDEKITFEDLLEAVVKVEGITR